MPSPWTHGLLMHGHIAHLETIQALIRAESRPPDPPRARRRPTITAHNLVHAFLDLIPARIRPSMAHPP